MAWLTSGQMSAFCQDAANFAINEFHIWERLNPGATKAQRDGELARILRQSVGVAEQATRAYHATNNPGQDFVMPSFDGYIRKIVENNQGGNPDASIHLTVKNAVNTATARDAARSGKRWMRVPGGDPCAFCLMLASRGAVYRSEADAKAGHDDCQCSIEVEPKPGTPEHAEYMKRLGVLQQTYNQTSGQLEMELGRPATMKEITARLRRDYPDLLRDGVGKQRAEPERDYRRLTDRELAATRKGLTKKEQDALMEYSSAAYSWINESLYNPDFVLPDRLRQSTENVIQQLDGALNKHPLQTDAILTRRTDSGWFGFDPDETMSHDEVLAELRRLMNAGESLRWPSYTSTTTHQEAEREGFGGYRVTLQVPAGTPAIYLDQVGRYDALTVVKGERELLLGRDLTGDVTAVNVGADGVPEVTITIRSR